MCPYKYTGGYEAKERKIEEKCGYFLMVYSFCKVDVSELRENGRRVQVKHKLSLGAHVDGEWEAGMSCPKKLLLRDDVPH